MSIEVKSILKQQRSSSQKVRLVVDEIRGLSVEKAIDILTYGQTKASVLVKKALDSAIANAENNHGLDIDELYVVKAFVDAGPTMKRFRARARGRGARILKRTCHISVIVSEKNRRT